MAFSTKSFFTRDTDNSSTSYAKVASDTSYEYYNNITWSMWVAAIPGANRDIFSMYDETPNARSWLFSVQDDQTFRIIGSWDGSSICLFKTVNPIFDASWKNIVVTFSGGTFNCYVNGVLQSLNTIIGWGGSTTLYSANKQLMIASRDPSGPLADDSPAGRLSNFSMWNTVLSPSQISEIYNGGAPKDLTTHSAYANLTNWFRLDQTDTSSTLTDSRAGITAAITTSVSGIFAQTDDHPTYSMDPGSVTVINGQSYVIDGEAKIGSLMVPTASQVAQAVWDEATSSATTSASMGELVNSLKADTQTTLAIVLPNG